MNASRQFEGTKSEPEKRKQRFELSESIILSIAILGTAWSAYQAALWNGIETFLGRGGRFEPGSDGKALVYRAAVDWSKIKKEKVA